MVKRKRGPRPILISGLALIAAAAVGFHFDWLGRISYAVEKAKLQADLDHIRQINVEDVAALEQVSHSFSVIAEAVKPSVVYVESLSENTAVNKQLEEIFGKHNFQPEPSTGTGSGVIIDADGYIVTNNHVIEDADTVRVMLADGRRYRAEVVGSDPKTDVAVIKIKADRLHPATFGDSALVKVGHVVLAIGSPFRLGHSVSHGIVSALGRSNVAVDIDYQNWIQTDAPINPGNSGGPLISSRGEVIGLNTAIATESGGNQGVGFAIPSNVVSVIAAKLRSGKPIVRGYLGVGIRPVDQAVAGAYGLDEVGGVLVEQVGPESPAEAAGLKTEDIILAINGRPLSTMEDLQQIIAATEPATSVSMSIWRGGKTQTVAVRVGEQPSDFSTSGSLRDLSRGEREKKKKEDAEAEKPRRRRDDPVSRKDTASDGADTTETGIEFKSLGFEAADVTDRLIERFKLEDTSTAGAIVTHVNPTGEAYAVRIRPGHIITEANGQAIKNAADLQRQLTPEAISKGVRLSVRWRSTEFHVVLRVQ